MANFTGTGLTVSDTSTLDDGQIIQIASARQAFEPSAPEPDVISNERISNGEKSWDILTYARLADAVALTEGVDDSSVQQLFANFLSVNPTEHGSLVSLSSRAMRRQPESLMGIAGRMQAISIRARMSKDILALFSGFSKDVGSAGNTLDLTVFRGTNAYLITDNDTEFGPAQTPIVAMAHAEHISDIVADLTTNQIVGMIDSGATALEGATNTMVPVAESTALSGAGVQASDRAHDATSRWWRGSDRAYGTQVFHSGYMTRDGSDDAILYMGAPDAMHLVMETDAEPTQERDESLRATEVGLFQSWGEAERADPHGVAGTFDAAATV